MTLHAKMGMSDLQQNQLKSFVFVSLKCLNISLVVSLQKWLAIFLRIRSNGKIYRNKHFSSEYSKRVIKVELPVWISLGIPSKPGIPQNPCNSSKTLLSLRLLKSRIPTKPWNFFKIRKFIVTPGISLKPWNFFKTLEFL